MEKIPRLIAIDLMFMSMTLMKTQYMTEHSFVEGMTHP